MVECILLIVSSLKTGENGLTNPPLNLLLNLFLLLTPVSPISLLTALREDRGVELSVNLPSWAWLRRNLMEFAIRAVLSFCASSTIFSSGVSLIIFRNLLRDFFVGAKLRIVGRNASAALVMGGVKLKMLVVVVLAVAVISDISATLIEVNTDSSLRGVVNFGRIGAWLLD